MHIDVSLLASLVDPVRWIVAGILGWLTPNCWGAAVLLAGARTMLNHVVGKQVAQAVA